MLSPPAEELDMAKTSSGLWVLVVPDHVTITLFVDSLMYQDADIEATLLRDVREVNNNNDTMYAINARIGHLRVHGHTRRS